MANTKEYQIKINGLTESISAVESLNKQLDKLEQRMNTLSSAKVSTGGGSSASRGSNSALSEEERVQKEINKLKEQGAQLDAKIAASQDEIYKRVDATKQLYKATIADQKAIAAQERLTADAYSNTMVGMKQQLADIKAVIQTTDLGDSDQIKKMTEQANELTNKLKEMEEAYGQFGRNVGNYKSALDGIGKVSLNIGGVTREFNNAREATRTLNNELKTMAANGQQDTEAFKQLRQAVMELESNINDAKKPMDDLMDTMESFAAIGTISTGISGLFGIDNSEIEKSIQKMVAFQNVLKGIETINKQIQTREGIGAWIAPFNNQINAATTKLLAFNTALLGTGKAARVAAVGIKAFGTALKAIGIGLLVAGIAVAIEKVTEFIEKMKKASEEQKKVQEAAARAYGEASAQLLQYQTRVDNFNGTVNEEKKLVESLNKDLGDAFGTYKSLAQWKKVLKDRTDAYIQSLVLEAQIQAKINQLVEAYERLDQVKQTKGDFRIFGSYSKDFNEANNKIKELEKDINNLVVSRDKLNKDNKLFDYSDQIKKGGTKTKDTVAEIEKEIAQARLNAMKEGLNKTITQLEEERKQRLAKLKTNATLYKKYEKEINAIYDQRILEARQEWADKMEKVNKDLWNKIYADTLENTKRIEALTESSIEAGRRNIEDTSNTWFNQNIGSYGIQGKKQLKPTTQFSLGMVSANESQFMQDMKLEVDLMREAQAAQNEYIAAVERFNREKDKLSDEEFARLNLELDHLKRNFSEREKILEDYRKELSTLYDKDLMDGAKQALFNENYGGDLSTMFNQRMSAIEAYWQRRLSFESKAANALYEAQKQSLNEQYNAEERELRQHNEDLIKEAEDYAKKMTDTFEAELKNRIITQERYNEKVKEVEKKKDEAIERIAVNFETEWKARSEKHAQDLVRIEKDKNNTLKQTNAEYYQAALQELRDFQTAQSNLESKQPVKNAWGITNFKETNENYRNLLVSYETMANKILEKRAQVNKDFKNGVIDKNAFESTIRELDNFSADLGDKMDNVKNKLNVSTQIGQFIQDIQQYVQALGQGLQQLMSSIWDYQDYMFEKEQYELDEWNEKLDDALKEQQDIIEQHKDNVDSIEDELATARGDRRQHLIDQLNAEIAAQRAAQKEEQRIQKEKEQAKKKQDKLDEKRRKEEYNRNVMQAFISWHLSIANGLATQPFLPVGIAMGALATALGAVQYALVKSQKPYAKGGQLDGGVAQGARHRDGGIPVLGGRASIEGGEFITNRRTTAQNVDLLEFVNSKHRKLSIDDFVDFYSTTPRKVIRGVRTKFEDGGYLPTLPSTLDVKDQLQNIVINQDNRPIVVSVVDINNKQDQVRRVQTLAGL